jgi:hypothetical protein
LTSGVQMKSVRLVLRSENGQRVVGHGGSRRHVRERPPVRTAEPQLSIGVPVQLEALLMDGTMVAATQQCEI